MKTVYGQLVYYERSWIKNQTVTKVCLVDNDQLYIGMWGDILVYRTLDANYWYPSSNAEYWGRIMAELEEINRRLSTRTM